MRKILALIAVLGIFCPAAYAADEYVFILMDRGNPYWQTMVKGIEEGAKKHGVAATTFLQESGAAAETQLIQCETAILRKPKAIVMSAVNPSVGAECFKKAQAKGILVADVDSAFSVENARRAGITLSFTVGSDNFKIGGEAANFIAARANGKTGKVLVIEGAPGSVAGKARADGFKSKLKEIAPNLNIVASLSGMWDRLKAGNITAEAILQHPDLSFIYTANDLMALGAAEALRSNPRVKEIQIIGVDGTADARKALLENKIVATVAQLPALIGERAAELAVEAAQGSKPEREETTPSPILTAEMLQAGTDPILKYVR